MVQFLKYNTDYSAVFSSYYIVSENYEYIGIYKKGKTPNKIGYKYLLKNRVPFSMIVFRRELINLYGYYDESLKTCEDWELWLRFTRDGQYIGHIEEFLSVYMDRRKSLSRTYHPNLTEISKYIFKKQNIKKWKSFSCYRYHIGLYRCYMLYLAFREKQMISIFKHITILFKSPIFLITRFPFLFIKIIIFRKK
jgi:hypothetical protein